MESVETKSNNTHHLGNGGCREKGGLFTTYDQQVQEEIMTKCGSKAFCLDTIFGRMAFEQIDT